MNMSHECLCHPEKEPIPAWNYLGMIDLVCPVCRKQATEVKQKPTPFYYYQHGETGRTCATIHILKGDWYEITKEAYFEISARENPPHLSLPKIDRGLAGDS